MPALLALGLGLGLGLACGGRVGALSELRLRGELLIVPLFVAQALLRGRLLGLTESTNLAVPVWVMVSLSLAVCLFLNLRVRGSFVLAMGFVINAIVVLANQGMPVATPGIPVNGVASGFYVIAGPSTLGSFAGDVMPAQLGSTTLMISVGDVLLVVGVCTMLISAMLSSDTFSGISVELESSGLHKG